MKRNTWEFKYETPIVFAAAQNKENQHAERYKFYLAEFRAADNDWRQSEEAFKSTQGFDSTYSNQPLQNRVNELRGKVRHHDSLQKEFATWQRILAKSTETHLSLNHDDILYFGLISGTTED